MKFLLAAILGGVTFAYSQAIEFAATPNPVNLQEKTTLKVKVSDDIEGVLQYKFTYGDGTAATEWLDEPEIKYSYALAGHYRATVQVRTSSSIIGIKQLVITAIDKSIKLQQSNKSTSIAVNSTSGNVWTVNPDNDSVSRITKTGIVKEIKLGNNCHPRTVALIPGEVWITCQKNDRIKVLNRAGKKIKTIELSYGSEPIGLAANSDQTFIYVALFGKGELVKISTLTKQIVDRIKLAPTAYALAIIKSKIFVTRFISPTNHAEVWEVVDSDQGLKLKNTITLIADSTTPDTQNSGRGIPNYLSSITIDPTGKYALVTANKANTLRGVFVDGNDLTTTNTIRSMIAKINLASSSEDYQARRDIDNSESPSALSFSTYGDYIFVTLQGNNFVAVFDNLINQDDDTNFHATLTRVETDLAPQGIIFDQKRSKFIVQNFMARSITNLSADSFLKGTSSGFDINHITTIKDEKLDAEVLLGKQIFYNASDNGGINGANRMSSEGYLSCASCHIDGSEDGRVWDFTGRGEGLRNTTDLRGRNGTSHGRVHWSANFDEIQDFENDIRLAFGGTGFLSDTDFTLTSNPLGAPKAGLSAELDALSAYLSSLDQASLPRSPHRKSDGSISNMAIAGKQIFESLNCVDCHVGNQFTDSQLSSSLLHDVGTIDASSGNRLGGPLTGIDTPTLLGVFSSPPYFHNGKAATLSGVLSGADSPHGVIVGLNGNEEEALIQFLLQLDGRSASF